MEFRLQTTKSPGILEITIRVWPSFVTSSSCSITVADWFCIISVHRLEEKTIPW
ncbi:hypothetical protein D3C81_2205030 [compost metagenome]